MLEFFPYIIAMAIAIVMIVILSNKLKVAYPVMLVLAGLLVCFIPGIPEIEIEPE